MKNLILSEVSAQENARFVPSASDLAASFPDMELAELVSFLGGRITGYVPDRVRYYFVQRSTGDVMAEVDYSRQMSLFGGIPMFANGQWKEKASLKSLDCIRADVYETSR